MLHLILGRARTGKSAWVLQRIGALGDSSRQILLVPEHASYVAEVDVCRACGETASRHAEVLTFKLLASRVLSICGGAADLTLDGGGKVLLLQRTLQELSPSLKVYRKPSQRAAFLESMLALMEELSAYAVVPETFLEKAETLTGESGDRLRDIALIYGLYQAKLREGGRDARDRLEKLEEALAASGYVDGKDVFIDGFSYFTRRESNILRILLRRARSVTVTLLGDRTDRELFRESFAVRDALVRLAEEEGVPCTEEILEAEPPRDALAHVERFFFEGEQPWEGAHDALRLYEAVNAYSETEWVASEILRLVRTEGYRFRDITVTARDLEQMLPLIENVFARYGIPLYSSHRSDILRQNVIALLTGALDAVSGGFEYEDIFRCLKTGLAGLEAQECDLLENYAIKWDVRGAMWLRETEWSAHPDGYGAQWREEDKARLAAVNALREKVSRPLRRLAEGVRGSSPAEEKIAALYAYLEEVGLPKKLEAQTRALAEAGELQRAEELAQLWNILCEVFDQFVEILGGSLLDEEEFARLMRLVLTQYSIGTIPVSLDRVNCSEMTRNDRHAVRCLFLMQANDHIVPAVNSSSGILREEDRLALEELEIALAPHGMAQFRLELQNLYAALAQPTQKLYVSYPVTDDGGSTLRPSYIVGRLQTLCPGVTIEKEDADKAFRLSAETTALEYAGEHIGGEAWEYFAARGDRDDVLRAMESAAGYTRGSLSPEVVRTLYGTTVTLSASRMDQARSCHFAYFMRYGLRARERTTAGFDAPQIGTFVHDVMEHTLKSAKLRGGLKALDKRELHALVREAIRDYIARELPDIDEKNARFRYLFERLSLSAYRIIDTAAEELRDSDFEPLAFELSFGAGGQLPAISIRTPEQTASVVGQVDRVDGWLHDGKLYLRVVDYKTGVKQFDLSELRYGLGLQMLLYLFALEQEGKELFGHPIVPAGVLYFPARDKILKLPRDVSEEDLGKALRKELRRSGMVLRDPEVLTAMEHSALEAPVYLPISVKHGDDGAIKIEKGVASAEQFGKLALYTQELLRKLLGELRDGNIDADPWRRNETENACQFCEFASACHFDAGAAGDRFEVLGRVSPEEFWDHVEKVIGREGERTHG